MARMMSRRAAPAVRNPSSGMGDVGSPATSTSVQVPHLNRDPVWSLCPWPVVVTAPGGFSCEIEALPAVHWLQFLLGTDPDIAGLTSELMPELEDFFLDRDEFFDVDEMHQITLDVISTVTARPWWQAIRLTSCAAANWDVLGPKLLAHGADPMSVSIAAWLDVLLVVLLENMEPSKVTMFTMQLEALPPFMLNGGEQTALDLLETDRSSFLAMAAD